MPRTKHTLDVTDQVKVLIGDMNVEQMESVKKYLDYFLSEKKKSEKKDKNGASA